MGYNVRNFLRKSRDIRSSCEGYQYKLHGQRCSVSYLHHHNFTNNGYLLVFYSVFLNISLKTVKGALAIVASNTVDVFFRNDMHMVN